MSTMLSTPYEALALGMMMAGVKQAEIFPDDTLKVSPPFSRNHDTSQQRGFRFENSRGVEVAVVVDVFREGYCCWGLLDGGLAIRF